MIYNSRVIIISGDSLAVAPAYSLCEVPLSIAHIQQVPITQRVDQQTPFVSLSNRSICPQNNSIVRSHCHLSVLSASF